jgi:AcrR family transcriptional regulator
MAEVKGTRSYDSSRRREQAARMRDTVLDVARRAFLGEGYAATTIPQVAAAAGVSAETVYKAFGGKSGLVRALWEQALAGNAPTPAPERSDAMTSSASSPEAVLRGWGRFLAELAPQGAPIVLLVRAAATSDPEMSSLLTEIDTQRRTRMRHNARRLHRRGWLRPGLSVDRATDLLWTYSSPELYELIVVKSGWSPRRYGEFVADALVAAILADAPHA